MKKRRSVYILWDLDNEGILMVFSSEKKTSEYIKKYYPDNERFCQVCVYEYLVN